LATTEEHKVPITIKSRCQQFNFRLLTAQEIQERLQLLVDREQLNVEPEVLSLVAQHGAGSLRDAESLLDQLIGAPGDLISVRRAQMVLGTASSATVLGLATAVLTADGAAGLQIIQEALNTGADARQLCRQIVGHLRDLLLLQTAGGQIRLDMPAEQQAELLAQAGRAGRQTLIQATKLFSEAASAPATSWQPQLPLELAFIQAISQPVSLSASQPVSQSASQLLTTHYSLTTTYSL
jgi:DNA polymerase-3 subunit gamma/tau